MIESYTITGMAHGTPLATGTLTRCGVAGPFLLEVGISSSYHIAKFFGLTGEARERAQERAEIHEQAASPWCRTMSRSSLTSASKFWTAKTR